MFTVLDNAESVPDPHAPGAQEIYVVVEEPCQLSNLYLTSRTSTPPPDFEWLDIPPLSKEAARDTFHRICKHNERSELIENILEQDFRTLPTTLLATVT